MDSLHIPLTRGVDALIDIGDLALVGMHSWHACLRSDGDGFYATRSGEKRGAKSIRMHRQILGVQDEPDVIVDHINGNTLDNRRCNLRIVTPAQNVANSRINRNNKSGFKGVSFHSKTGKWIAHIGKARKHLGLFLTAEEAAVAYQKAAIELRGEYARFQ